MPDRSSIDMGEAVKIELPAELIAKLEAVPDTTRRTNYTDWTPEMDEAIRRYWPRKNKKALAKALGVCSGTLRKRAVELGVAE